ncbi:MAG TPA: TaqI-like C-terminal specificity domain-containing protein, partial [Symbiobacteriaceae bacterium]|nr:TaqI-like C-terminal specificity domain-containing protein [Symbiobacteriaceae bacterium]
MNLDKAMAILAEHCRSSGHRGPVTDQIRTELLALMQGERSPLLASEEHAAIKAWLHAEFGSRADPAGTMYEATLGYTVSVADGGVTVHKERRRHRATGAYYTQETVVRYMVARARQYAPWASAVVDPACGSGAFLTQVRQEFADVPMRLVGFDADPTALELCRHSIPAAELHAVDALTHDLPGGFDLCLGNPPYISSGLRGAAPHNPQYHAELKRRFPATAQYKVNTYPLFIERGLSLLRDGGVLGFIVPDSFLSGRYFEGLRRTILRHTLLELTLLCDDFWEHGRVGHSVILFVRKEPSPANHLVNIALCPSVADLACCEPAAMPVAEITWGSLLRFRLIPDLVTRRFIRQMEAAPGIRPLSDFVRTYSGLIARHGQAGLLRSTNPHLSGPWGRLLRSGKEIDRYRLCWAGEEVCLRPELIKSGGHLAYYQNPKLLLRQTADALRAVYDDTGIYCLNNIHLLIPRSPVVSLRALLGLI